MMVLAQVRTCLSLTVLAGFAGDLALQQSGETLPVSASVEGQKAAASLFQAVFPCQGLH